MKNIFDLKKLVLGAMVLILAYSLTAPLSAEEKYPSGPITIVFGFGAGGGGDLQIRMVAKEMQKEFKVPVIVENKAGGGGVLSWSIVQAAKPDGYTVVWLSSSLMMETVNTQGKVNYKNFEPVFMFQSTPGAVTVHKDAPYKTIDEFFAYAKANPFKVRVGNSGFGASWHVYAIIIEKLTGVKFTHVPFKTAADCGPALLGRHIEATTATPGDFQSSFSGGELRVLATTGEERDPFFPDAPTLKEKGVNFAMEMFRAVGVPKGTPKERIEILEKACLKAIQNPDYQDLLKRLRISNKFQGTTEFRKTYSQTAELVVPIMEEFVKSQKTQK